jgi:hypothetical protein
MFEQGTETVTFTKDVMSIELCNQHATTSLRGRTVETVPLPDPLMGIAALQVILANFQKKQCTSGCAENCEHFSEGTE